MHEVGCMVIRFEVSGLGSCWALKIPNKINPSRNK